MKKKYKIIIPLIIFIIFIVGMNFVSAQTSVVNQLDSSRIKSGDMQLSDFVTLMIIVSDIILMLSGSLALVAFVIGGFMFLISGGNKNTVEKGKSTIIGAVIGLVIVFASYLIINTIMNGLGITKWTNVTDMINYMNAKDTDTN